MPQIKIHAVICNVPDESDKDEIYLKIEDKKVWPQKSKFSKIGVDEALNVDVEGNFQGDWLALELWDFDYTSKNDHLGTFHLDLNQDPGHYGEILTNNMEVSEHADYMLNWEIIK
ncbi:C2 domain-containing protein [Ekhidna sp.]